MNLDQLTMRNRIAVGRRDIAVRAFPESDGGKRIDAAALPDTTDRRRHFPVHGHVEVRGFAGDPTVLMLCANDDHVALAEFWGTPTEPVSLALWRLLCRNSPLTLDIGAYTGLYGLVAAAENPAGRVVCLEPLPEIHARLMANKTVNAFKNLIAVDAAAGDAAGTFEISAKPADDALPTSSSLARAGAGMTRRFPVRVVRVDDLPDLGKAKVGAIKIDAERHEPAVLRGMTSVVARWKPDMLVELLGPDEFGAFRSSLNEIAPKANYHVYAVDEANRQVIEVPNGTAPLLPAGARVLNYLFLQERISTLTGQPDGEPIAISRQPGDLTPG